MKHKIKLYSLYERIWHWIQAISAIILIITGFSISYPDLMPFGFKESVEIHNIMAAIFLINAFLALFYNLSTGLIIRYIPFLKNFLPNSIKHAHYYIFGIFRGDNHPFEKTKEDRLLPLQKLTYFMILNFLLPLMIFTGILKMLYNSNPNLVEMFGGINFLCPLHRFGAWLFLSFLILHVYMITTGKTVFSSLIAMITGYETISNLEEGEKKDE